MTRSIKFLLLFLALLLPGLIYVFLKTFGRNEFDVPALYQDSVPYVGGCESYSYIAPYVVPDSIIQTLEFDGRSIALVFFEAPGSEAGQGRIDAEFTVREFAYLYVPDTINNKLSCALLLRPPNNVVIVDSSGLIRGQYDATDREDTDRLIMEMQILLKKY